MWYRQCYRWSESRFLAGERARWHCGGTWAISLTPTSRPWYELCGTILRGVSGRAEGSCHSSPDGLYSSHRFPPEEHCRDTFPPETTIQGQFQRIARSTVARTCPLTRDHHRRGSRPQFRPCDAAVQFWSLFPAFSATPARQRRAEGANNTNGRPLVPFRIISIPVRRRVTGVSRPISTPATRSNHLNATHESCFCRWSAFESVRLLYEFRARLRIPINGPSQTQVVGARPPTVVGTITGGGGPTESFFPDLPLESGYSNCSARSAILVPRFRNLASKRPPFFVRGLPELDCGALAMVGVAVSRRPHSVDLKARLLRRWGPREIMGSGGPASACRMPTTTCGESKCGPNDWEFRGLPYHSLFRENEAKMRGGHGVTSAECSMPPVRKHIRYPMSQV